MKEMTNITEKKTCVPLKQNKSETDSKVKTVIIKIEGKNSMNELNTKADTKREKVNQRRI